jgi:hypothetical protein
MEKKNLIVSIIFIVASLVVTVITGVDFRSFYKYEAEFVPSQYVTDHYKLSDFHAPLAKLNNGSADADVWVVDSGKPGASILVLGGTHPNEPSGQLTATMFLENAQVTEGKLFVITETDKSGYRSTNPQDGASEYFEIQAKDGTMRKFKYGARSSSQVDQWPVPDVYVHAQSGMKLSGGETRNLNRGYPGRPDGNFTEQIAYSIVQLIKQNDITITIDLHEASPEYPVINAMVAHQRALTIAAAATFALELQDIKIAVEPSPASFHGLTHRELGDWTDTIAILMETGNPSQGRIRGKFRDDLAVTGHDKFYEALYAKTGTLITCIPIEEGGLHLNERVGRHTTSILAVIDAYNKENKKANKADSSVPLKQLKITNMPSYNDLLTKGVGAYLNGSKR